LNREGIHQIERLVRFFTSKRPDTIFTSPLRRARQTAEIIAGHYDLTPVESDELREIDFGDWEGLSDQSEDVKRWMDAPDTVTPPNGESIHDLHDRVTRFTHAVVRDSRRQATLCVVTHGGPIRSALMTTLNIPASRYWNIKIPHGSVTCLEHDDDAVRVCFMGQTAF
jgi:alpha-ribazole phosphatase